VTIITENYDDETIYTRDELKLRVGRYGNMASVTLGRREPTGRSSDYFNILVEPESRTVLAGALAGEEYVVVHKGARTHFPRREGDYILLGPETFSDADKTVISHQGENYYRDRFVSIVRGRCPACRRGGLVVGDEGHVRCSHADCPRPESADNLLRFGDPDPKTVSEGNTRTGPDDEFWEATRAGAPTVVDTRPPAGVLRFTVASQPDADAAWAIARLVARKFYHDRPFGLSMTDVRTGIQRAFSPQMSFDCQFEARPGTAFELNRHGVREWEDGS
jgi:hypothetical protein